MPHVHTTAGGDLGPEPPAVAGMLCRGGRVGDEAAAATLLDLAARHVVDVEETDAQLSLCRIRQPGAAGLAPYERRILSYVDALATGRQPPDPGGGARRLPVGGGGRQPLGRRVRRVRLRRDIPARAARRPGAQDGEVGARRPPRAWRHGDRERARHRPARRERRRAPQRPGSQRRGAHGTVPLAPSPVLERFAPVLASRLAARAGPPG
jgi:hypothetical protein